MKLSLTALSITMSHSVLYTQHIDNEYNGTKSNHPKHNYTTQIGIHHFDTQHNNIHHNATHHNNIKHNPDQHNYSQHNYNQQNNKNATHSLMTFSIMIKNATLCLTLYCVTFCWMSWRQWKSRFTDQSFKSLGTFSMNRCIYYKTLTGQYEQNKLECLSVASFLSKKLALTVWYCKGPLQYPTVRASLLRATEVVSGHFFVNIRLASEILPVTRQTKHLRFHSRAKIWPQMIFNLV